MTTITAGTSLGSGLVYDSDTTGNLVIKTGDSATIAATFHGNSATTFNGSVYIGGGATPVNPLTLGTANTSVSGGTVIVHGSIPTWARRVTIMYSALSTNGISPIVIQLATGGTFKTSGYLGAAAVIEGATGYTVGFGIGNSNVSSTDSQHGSLTLNLLDPATNTWIAGGTAARSDGVEAGLTSGAVSLTGALDSIRFTTIGGTDLFDVGMTNIMWE